jgi:hypothetical protein
MIREITFVLFKGSQRVVIIIIIIIIIFVMIDYHI